MLSSVVAQCLSMALASASRKVSLRGHRSSTRGQQWQAPLAAYPRLAAALERAAMEGVLSRGRSGQAFH